MTLVSILTSIKKYKDSEVYSRNKNLLIVLFYLKSNSYKKLNDKL